MWRLDVYYPDGSQAASYSPSSPGGIVGPIRWASYPTGGTVRIMLDAVPSMTTLPPRGIAVLYWQGQPVAAGVIVRTWPTWDGHVRTYELASPKYIMRMRQTGMRTYERTSASTIISDMVGLRPTTFMTAHVPPIPDTTKVDLSIQGSVPVADVLDRVLPLVGMTWDVLPGWPLRLAVMSASPRLKTLRYEDGTLSPAPVDWTGVPDTVIALVRLPEHQIESYWNVKEAHAYLPYQIALGSGWAEAAVVVASPPTIYKAGPEYFLLDTFMNADNPSYALDGNPSTYASNSATDIGSVAVRLLESSTLGKPIGVAAYGQRGTFMASSTSWYVRTPMPTDSIGMCHIIVERLGPASSWLIWPPRWVYASVYWLNVGSDSVRIHEFYAVFLDYAAVENAVRSIYTPVAAINGGEVWLARYEPPAGALSVQGSPYGDVSGPVETVEYEISLEAGIRTVYRLGRTNDLVRELTQRSAVDLSSTSRLTGGIL